MAYNKTNWQEGITALGPTNLNKIENGIETAHNLIEVDVRTPDDTQAAQSSGTILQILNFFANMIKRITGKTNWYIAPSVTLEDASTHINDTNNPHNVTPSQIGAVDTTTFNNHAGNTNNPHDVTNDKIGAASGQRKTGSVNAGWIRIAQGGSSCAQNVALFRVTAILSGKHSSILFSASVTYGQEANITVLESSTYFTAGVSKIRLLKNSTYDQPYIEVYVTGDSLSLSVEMIGSYGWSLIAPTTGNIPTNYTSHEVDLTVGNGGIIAYNNIYVGANKVWHEGNDGVGSGLNADFLQDLAPLDVAKLAYVTGTYTGDATATRFINLGFTPSAVIVCSQKNGFYRSNIVNPYQGGIALNGYPAITSGGLSIVEIVANGFNVFYDAANDIGSNQTGTYFYIAFK